MSSAIVDGRPGDSISVFDEGLLRGDGCFEAIRAYDGVPFAFDLHFQRLQKSAAALEIGCPAASELRPWVEAMAAEGGDCIVRVILTRGAPDRLPSRCVVLWHPLTRAPSSLRLLPMPAPWHPQGEAWELSGVKTTSYAPNMAANRRARSAGYDDALLVSVDGLILEGPTFAVAWVGEGVLQSPGLELGILDSITSRLVLAAAEEAGWEVMRGRFELRSLQSAAEVVALSTVKEVTPVRAVGDWRFTPGVTTSRLSDLLRNLVEADRSQYKEARDKSRTSSY
jgi:4-amino-4-deoxychorismate lyase